MSNRQFIEWMAYFEIEPFGDDWVRTALLASIYAEANRDPEKRSKPYTPLDFLPVKFLQDEEPKDPDASWKRNKELFRMLAELKEAQ